MTGWAPALDPIWEDLAYVSGHGVFHMSLAQKLCRLFRWRGIDPETSSPFESRRLGQLGHELDVPVVVIVSRILRRRSVDHQVIRRIIQYPVGSAHQVL